MSYQVLARKWRPQTFDAVVGQEPITRTLKNALVSGRLAHAYLFAGPRGVGKTTTARLLAKALLCSERAAAEPCGACAACQEVQAGTAVDVIEIDGASNRKIEDVRALRENVKYAPARGRYKVYIIDEAHQLTPEAFNALLKTLEEPPPHVVFILATTDPRDMPSTILSRVQRFDFRPIAPDTLAGALERILREERVAFEPGALPVLVRAAEGSLRDALSLLDTVVAYGDGRLEAESTARLLGSTASAEVSAFVTALIAHEIAPALEAIDRAARAGEDLQAFARDVVEMLRRLLILKAAPTVMLPNLMPGEVNELRELGHSASLDEFLYTLRAFLEADALMRESPHPRLELEVATVRATRRPVPQALEEVLRRIDDAEVRLRQHTLMAAPPAAVQESLLAPSAGEARRPSVPPRRAPIAESPGAAPAPPPVAPGPDLTAAWPRIVDEVMKQKPMLGAVLSQARPGPVRDGQFTLVLAGNHFHRDMLADAANRDLVMQAVRRYIPDAERFTVKTEGETPGGVTAHPLVQAAMAEFEGEVVAVRPRPPEGDEP